MSVLPGVSLALSFGGFEWSRPFGVVALLLPLVILLLSRRREPPRDDATGAFSIWKSLAAERGASSRTERRGLPLRLLWLLGALVLAALALAGPRREGASDVADWTIVLDRSPSMYLPLEAGGAEPRIARAVREAQDWLDEHDVPAGARLWCAGASARERGAGPPAAWLQAPRQPFASPRWERFDAPGRLWVSDALLPQPDEASWLATGGAAIPGPISRGLRWDGENLIERAAVGSGHVAALNLPVELEALLELWCDERGLSLAGERSDALLMVRGTTQGASETRVAGRDGWQIRGAWLEGGAPSADEHGALEEWLAPGLVTTARGRVYLALSEVDEQRGDPAAFAVSWSQLFDSACLTGPEVVSLSERRAAGEGGQQLGSLPDAEDSTPDDAPIEAWLLLAAFGLAVAWRLTPPAA